MKNVNDVIEECKSGNDKAYEKLYALLAPKMLAVCFRYANNKVEAEDLMHDGFMLVFNKINTFRSDGSGEGWVRRIMVNNAINHVKKNHALKFSEELEEVSDDGLPLTNDTLMQLAYTDIIQKIRQLPEGYKMVFNLFAIEGFSHKEIAERLGISESTSKTQYRMARMRLAQELADLYPEYHIKQSGQVRQSKGEK